MHSELDEHLKDDFEDIKDSLLDQIEQWNYGEYLYDLRIDRHNGFRVATKIKVNVLNEIMLYTEVEAIFRVKVPCFFSPKLPPSFLNFEVEVIIVSFFSINEGNYKLEVIKLAKDTPQDLLENTDLV